MTATFNPYCQPRPRRASILARGRFFLADENGTYSLNPQRVELVLCRDYLWIRKNFSIPLNSIRGTQLTKHGGVIHYWDAVAGQECRFDFTKVGFLLFRRKDVEKFLSIVNEHLVPAESTAPVKPTRDGTRTTAHDSHQPQGIAACEVCRAAECRPYLFFTLRFVGIAPIAYAYELTPWRHVLCPDHARRQLLRSCAYTAFFGSLGFPGFLAVPYYVCKNLWMLHRGGAADAPIVLLCFVSCAILPILTLALIVAGLVYWLDS